MSNAIKMQYLVSVVQSLVATRCKSMQLVKANFDLAWVAFVNRYDSLKINPAYYSKASIDLESVFDLVRLINETGKVI